jgi:hypothetical protein
MWHSLLLSPSGGGKYQQHQGQRAAPVWVWLQASSQQMGSLLEAQVLTAAPVLPQTQQRGPVPPSATGAAPSLQLLRLSQHRLLLPSWRQQDTQTPPTVCEFQRSCSTNRPQHTAAAVAPRLVLLPLKPMPPQQPGTLPTCSPLPPPTALTAPRAPAGSTAPHQLLLRMQHWLC